MLKGAYDVAHPVMLVGRFSPTWSRVKAGGLSPQQFKIKESNKVFKETIMERTLEATINNVVGFDYLTKSIETYTACMQSIR